MNGLEELVEALQIFSKYMSEDEKQFPTNCAHDELHIMCTSREMAPEDLARLEKLGFEFDDDMAHWVSYKYGSA